MNSETPTTSTPLTTTPLPGTPSTQPASSSPPSSLPFTSEDPIENLLDKLVHEMTPEELNQFIKQMAALRSSAQTRKAALNKESVSLGAEKKPKKAKAKDSVAMAEEFMKMLGL